MRCAPLTWSRQPLPCSTLGQQLTQDRSPRISRGASSGHKEDGFCTLQLLLVEVDLEA